MLRVCRGAFPHPGVGVELCTAWLTARRQKQRRGTVVEHKGACQGGRCAELSLQPKRVPGAPVG